MEDFSENYEKIKNFIETKTLDGKIINFLKTDLCIGATIRAGIYWEKWMFNYIKNLYKPGSNMIDAGANIGTTSLLMSDVVTEGNKIYSFEPLFYDLTYKNVLDNNKKETIKVYNVALGNTRNTIPFKQISIETRANFGATSLLENVEDKSNIIDVYPIDYFNFQNVSLIKIDVEGMEMSVLEGMINLIRNNLPSILIETHQINSFKNSDIFTELKTLGYSITQLSDGHNDFLLNV